MAFESDGEFTLISYEICPDRSCCCLGHFLTFPSCGLCSIEPQGCARPALAIALAFGLYYLDHLGGRMYRKEGRCAATRSVMCV